MDEPLPLMGAPDAPSEDEYQAFVLALSESARGRALLAEHARRSRAADSEVLLTSVQRLEGLVRDYTEAPPPAEGPHDELRGMIEAIRGVQAELDISMLAEQVAKLATLIEGVQQRIETLALPAVPPPPAPTPAQALIEESMPDVSFAPPVEAEQSAAEAVFESETVTEPLPEPEIDFAAASEPEFAPEPALTEEPSVEPAAEPETADFAEQAEPPMPDVAWPEETATAEEPPAAPPASGLAISALVETLAVPAADDEEPDVKVYKAGSIPHVALVSRCRGDEPGESPRQLEPDKL